MSAQVPPLLEAYPHLARGWTRLIDGPTPVQHLAGLGSFVGRDDLWMKLDGRTGRLAGGSKVRNLEFLLGAALDSGAGRLAALGAIQSNFAVSVAIYGVELEKPVTLFLANISGSSQAELTPHLDALTGLGADVRIVSRAACWARNVAAHHGAALHGGNRSCATFPIGGATPHGCLGPINAAFELADQVDRGLLPQPATIVLPVGSGGMIAGLLAGLSLAGIRCHLVGVRVINGPSLRSVAALARKALALVSPRDIALGSIEITDAYMPPGYGIETDRTRDNRNTLAKLEGVVLDQSYTAKAMSAFVDHARNRTKDGPILFWNTSGSIPRPTRAGIVAMRPVGEFGFSQTAQTGA